MGYSAGLDVDLRSSSPCIIDEQGKVCLERTVASEIDEIADATRGFAEHVDGVGLEIGNLTVKWHLSVTPAATEILMVHPADRRRDHVG